MCQAKARSCRHGPSSVKGLNTGLFPGAAITQPAFGWALDLTWGSDRVEGQRRDAWVDYRNGLWRSFGLAVLAVMAALRLRETHCRNISVEIG